MKFSGVCLITENVPSLVEFYQRVLCQKAQGDDVHAEFSFGGLGLAIFSRQGTEEMAPGSTAGAGTGGVTLMFEVEDVDAAYERLKGLPVEIVKPPQTYPWGARSVWFRDPDGNLVDFMQIVGAAQAQ